ncbi:SMP-30/gluconolactonase/LRE family protein [Tamlana sp. 2_MG-2023]|uniref:SMP-30/gluconolactonase/LRE family protein n=1 Tax=unclassified Tamlana TaxID=2614803 RepID=UPI0026E262B4|nr:MULTISPECIES: SMP-30/gluconolactonase/LRE family protein [unclassified Tamlana]MDO6759971.1 SMP-30/gluconolactonase/LRE family protein [Tamlana sp. 2_MG-2023]MDO6791859.1 SMP-30/gluconolactonase/LRE family protein [Tamlana sp. 1_MG-2023]
MLKPFVFFLVCISVFSCKTEKDLDTNLKAELVYEINAQLGEGALWNYKTQELYWVDIEGKTLNVYDPKTETNKVFETKSRIGTVVPVSESDVLIALEDGVYGLNLDSGSSAVFTNMQSELVGSRLNDGKCDPSGRFWVGSMHLNQEAGKANLYCIDGSGRLEKKLTNRTISNGIVWTSNKKTMYYIDTPTAQIKAFDYDDETATISNERVVVEIPVDFGYPDGMTIDEEDMLWVGMWNGNAVIRFNPKTGKAIQKIEVPAHNVTSCAFGGENLDVLYITTASVDMTDEEKQKYPLAGSLFSVVPGVKGVQANFFNTTTNN